MGRFEAHHLDILNLKIGSGSRASNKSVPQGDQGSLVVFATHQPWAFKSCPCPISEATVKEKVKDAQLRPTLCNPTDYTVHGILQARLLERQPFPSPRDLPNPGIEPRSPTL